MEKLRASDKVYARGVSTRVKPSEDGEPASPVEFSLHLDTGGNYRWYAEGSPTESTGASLRTAIGDSRVRWQDFQVIEVEGHAVSSETQDDIPERYAADDLEKVEKG